MCAGGYRNTEDGQLCGACAEGFHGYPNCKRETSEDFKDHENGDGGPGVACSLPMLPRNLNGRGMLEADGRASLHVQGDYWLDLRSKSHMMHVTISRPSALHVRIDLGSMAGKLGVAIAVELLSASGAGSPPKGTISESTKAGGNRGRLLWKPLTDVQDGVRSASGEGFVEAVLHPMASTGPNPSSSEAASSQRYRIILAYEVLGEIHGGKEDELCRSLGLQLAITPLDAIKKLVSEVDASCPSDANSRIDVDEHIDVTSKGWGKNGTFYISTAEPATRVMRTGKAIQPITIRIPEVPGKVARLSASLGYRFEMSSFGLLLEAESPDSTGGLNRPLCEAVANTAVQQDGADSTGAGKTAGLVVKGQTARGESPAAKGGAPTDEWSAWNDIGKNTGAQNQPAKAYYEDDSLPGRSEDDDNNQADKEEDDDDQGKRVGRGRDGDYDFHDLINSALSGLVHGGHNGRHVQLPHDAFPRMGGLPHPAHLPLGHLSAHPAGGDGGWVRGGPGEGSHIPRTVSRLWRDHPLPGIWGDDDEDDESDGDDDDPFRGIWGDGDDDDNDDNKRRRRVLLSAEGEGGGIAASSVLVERNEKEDEGPSGRVSVETMLRQPAAGSDDMFACRSGRERYNNNVIEQILPPGTYIVWLVRDTDFDEVLRGREGEGAHEMADKVDIKCLAFDLAMSVSFDDPPATPVTCEARTLPLALHEPGFLGPTSTRVHIQDTFYMRQVRLSRRHLIDFTVRGQGPSVLRAHVESQESIDIRLSVFKIQRTPGSDKATTTIVDVESPHVVGGLRGDAILSLLQPGAYKLQLEFLNPGGAPGFPRWDLGDASHGQGRQGGGRDGCEVLDLEIALMPLEDLGEDEDWKQECPGNGDGVDRIPLLQDVTGGRSSLRIGDSFNLPAPDGGSSPGESLLQRLREERAPMFWAQTQNGSRGYVIASYPLEVEALAVLRTGLRSDFVHDDLVLDVVDSAGRLVFTGAHRRSYNHIQSLIQPGRYTLKLRQSMSAAEVLTSKTSDHWIKKTDSTGKKYFFNTVSQTSQWHRPPAMAGSNCARFSFWLALDAFVEADDCHVAADAMTVPATLNSPGMLGSHTRAYLQGLYAIGGQQGLTPTGEGNSMHQTIRFTITRPSRIRAVVVPVPDELGNSVLTELTLHSIAPLTQQEENDGAVTEVEQVARGEFLSLDSYTHDEFDKGSSAQGGTEGVSIGAQQVLFAQITPEDEHASVETKQRRRKEGAPIAPRSFVLQLRHMLPPVQAFKCTKFRLLVSVEPLVNPMSAAATEGDDGVQCAGMTESKWPQISEDLTELFACDGSGGDADFKCWQDLHGMRVVQSARPARHRFAINLDTSSHLRIEMGFPLYSSPMISSIVNLGCPGGQGPCSTEGAEGKDKIAPLVSIDRPGSSVLVARWLPRGRYLVSLAQQALKLEAEDHEGHTERVQGTVKVVCERFSFRLVLEKVSAVSANEDHLGQHVQGLPLSLNGVPFLKFGGRAHLWGRYAMAHPGLMFWHCSLNFSLLFDRLVVFAAYFIFLRVHALFYYQ